MITSYAICLLCYTFYFLFVFHCHVQDKFLRGKGLPNLNNVDVHVLCCTVKHFLRSLKEPLVTLSLWQQFVAAANKKDSADMEAALYQAVSELPQPNRDTLAWIVLHLQRSHTTIYFEVK